MPEGAGLRLLITNLMLVYYLLNLVSHGQTTIFSFCGCGINRVWHISDTKVVPTPNRFWLGIN